MCKVRMNLKVPIPNIFINLKRVARETLYREMREAGNCALHPWRENEQPFEGHCLLDQLTEQ